MGRSIRRNGRVTLVAACVLGSLCIPATANAISDHNYSNAYETDQGNYTALSELRVDHQNIDPGPGGCDSYFTGSPIYQTMWLHTDAASEWLEFGVGHQCNGTKVYRFWGLADGGVWYPLDANNITPDGNTHEYRIRGDGDGTWRWRLDGNLKEEVFWGSRQSFGNTAVGLESYAPNGTAPAHNLHNLQYQRNGSTAWHDWAGRDSVQLNDPPMCGSWNSDTSRRVGQVNSC